MICLTIGSKFDIKTPLKLMFPMIFSAAMQCSKFSRLERGCDFDPWNGRTVMMQNDSDIESAQNITDSGIFNIIDIWNRFNHLIWWIFFRIWVYNLIILIFFIPQLHGPKYLEIPGSSTMVSKRLLNMNEWWNSYHIHPSCRFPVYVLASYVNFSLGLIY